MTATAHHTPSASPAPSAPAAPFEPTVAPAPGGPFWLVFCVMACSVFATLFGRLAPFSLWRSPEPFNDSPDSPEGQSFAILLRLIAIDWFRRSRSAPATPAELLRRSPVAQAVLSQSPAPVVPCDRPGENPLAGVFAPAFANQLAAASAAPLALTPSSFLNAYFATFSPHSRALFDDEANPDASATPRTSYSALSQSAIRNLQSAIDYFAFPRAPV